MYKDFLGDIIRWFSPGWWRYLLKKPVNLTKFLCRMDGHPEGPIWYNMGGVEPNMNCKIIATITSGNSQRSLGK